MSTDAFTSIEERIRHGKELRKKSPRASHGEWSPAQDRPDAVELLEEQNEGRLDWLIPVRRWRMSTSPFAFFRGGARIMAADLANTPVTGLDVQVCGDAHMANFGVFASPESQLVFDINDFDEILTGPWEWDIKRLVTSFVIAARYNGLKEKDGLKAAERVVRTYREAMADFAEMRHTDFWYAMLGEDQLIASAAVEGRKAVAQKITRKAKTRDSRQALDKLAEYIEGEFRIKSDPPGVIPLRDLPIEMDSSGTDLRELANRTFEAYKQTIPDDTKHLLDRYRLVDVALKVVGVGNVGNLCLILLLEGRDSTDPLFLQMKQAIPSVLEEYFNSSQYTNQGQRAVEGQRLMQTVSDIFLGWVKGSKTGKDFYMRQLRDWKGSADVEHLDAAGLYHLARLCGWTLARAHARSGDPVAIAGYLGNNDTLDKAMFDFATAYADQNKRDFEAFTEAISSGKLEAREG